MWAAPVCLPEMMVRMLESSPKLPNNCCSGMILNRIHTQIITNMIWWLWHVMPTYWLNNMTDPPKAAQSIRSGIRIFFLRARILYAYSQHQTWMKTIWIWQYLTHRGWASRRVAGLITAICGHIPNKNHEPLILLLKHMFTSPSNHIKPLKPL